MENNKELNNLLKILIYNGYFNYYSENNSKYFCEGILEESSLSLIIKDFGCLKQQNQLDLLIKKCATKEQILKDNISIIRNVWSIPSFNINNITGNWTSIMEDIINECKKNLNIGDEKINPVFNKMFICDTGSFSLPSKNHETENNFGTLFLFLPFNCDGGNIVISYENKSTSIQTDNSNDKVLKYCAFFNDCEYEMKMVMDGYKVILVYDLFKSGKRHFSAFYSIENNEKEKRKMSEKIENELNIQLNNYSQLIYLHNGKSFSKRGIPSDFDLNDIKLIDNLKKIKNQLQISLFFVKIYKINDNQYVLNNFIDFDENIWGVKGVPCELNQTFSSNKTINFEKYIYDCSNLDYIKRKNRKKASSLLIVKNKDFLNILKKYGSRNDFLMAKSEILINEIEQYRILNEQSNVDTINGANILINYMNQYEDPSFNFDNIIESIINKYFPLHRDYIILENIKNIFQKFNQDRKLKLYSLDKSIKYFDKNYLLELLEEPIEEFTCLGFVFQVLNKSIKELSNIVDDQIIVSLIKKNINKLVPHIEIMEDGNIHSNYNDIKDIYPTIFSYFPQFTTVIQQLINKIIMEDSNKYNLNFFNSVLEFCNIFPHQLKESKTIFEKSYNGLLGSQISNILSNPNDSFSWLQNAWSKIYSSKISFYDTKEYQFQFFNYILDQYYDNNLNFKTISRFIIYNFEEQLLSSNNINTESFSIFYNDFLNHYLKSIDSKKVLIQTIDCNCQICHNINVFLTKHESWCHEIECLFDIIKRNFILKFLNSCLDIVKTTVIKRESKRESCISLMKNYQNKRIDEHREIIKILQELDNISNFSPNHFKGGNDQLKKLLEKYLQFNNNNFRKDEKVEQSQIILNNLLKQKQ